MLYQQMCVREEIMLPFNSIARSFAKMTEAHFFSYNQNFLIVASAGSLSVFIKKGKVCPFLSRFNKLLHY